MLGYHGKSVSQFSFFLRLKATDGIITIITALNFRAVIIPEGAGESNTGYYIGGYISIF